MEPSTQPETVFTMPIVAPPVVTSPAAAVVDASQQTSASKLEQRLTAVLRGLTRGFACDAADFYKLNDDSTSLTLRAHYDRGGSEAEHRELGDERRSLSGARADVAAMAGSAIVLEDDLEVAAWPVPVWCAAAICLPVASETTIYGTLWLYSEEPRAFAEAEIELAEVVAGRLAADVELDGLRQDRSPTAPAPEHPVRMKVPAQPKTRLLQPATPALEDWELAGSTSKSDSERSYYDWQTFADGRTLIAAGAITGGTSDSAALLHSARVALRAHATESLDAGELLSRVNRTLWMASPGGEGLALAVAMLDSDGSRATVAMAGASAALRWRASTSEVLATTSSPVGWSERSVYVARGIELVVRERLVLAAGVGGCYDQAAQKRLTSKLQSPLSSDLRTMTGKRALQLAADATIAASGTAPSSLALVRRR